VTASIVTLAFFNGLNGDAPLWWPDRGQQREPLRHNRVCREGVRNRSDPVPILLTSGPEK